MSWTRRAWCALLLVSLVLLAGTAGLGISGAAVECAVVAAVIAMWLRSTARGDGPRASSGSPPDRRP
jgi:hypothetical protein